MSWFRDRMKSGVQAALAALLIQLVASFGHVHHDFSGAQGSVIAHATAQDHKPADGKSDHDEDICDICAALMLVASAQLPVPPVLPVPVRTYARIVTCLTAPVLLGGSYVNVRSRAPPTV